MHMLFSVRSLEDCRAGSRRGGKNSKGETERAMAQEVDTWGLVVVMARFFTFCLDIGITKSFGVLIPEMVEQLQVSNSTIGLVTSVIPATTYLGSPLAMLILVYGGHRRILASFCGLTAGLALMLTFFTRNVLWLSFMFFVTGFSCSLINLHGTILIFQYYGSTDLFGFFNCLSALGLPVGSIILPPFTEMLVETYGYQGALLVLGGLVFNLFPVCLTFKEPRIRHRNTLNSGTECRALLASSDKGRGSPDDSPPPDSERFRKSDPPLPENASVSNFDPANDPVLPKAVCHEDQTSMCARSRRQNQLGSCVDSINSETVECDQDNLIPIDEQANDEGLSIFQTVLKSLHVYILVEEPLLSFLFLPVLLTLFFTTGAWALFNVLYGLSQGLGLAHSSLLATSGATGGLVASILVSVILKYHPEGSPQLFFIGLVISSLFCFAQTLQASYFYLLMTSFLIGAGLFGANMTIEPVMAIVVRPENFPDACSFENLIIGVGYILSGYLAGTAYDLTHSMKTVFIFLGGTLLLAICLMVALIVCIRRRRQRNASDL